jgi:predicted nucleic acid-binding protein
MIDAFTATAIEHNLKLVTRDEGYKNIPKLMAEFY